VKNRFNHVTMHVGQTAINAVVAERESRMIDAKQV
jgi:hypothetical protein